MRGKQLQELEVTVPNQFRCPISLELMRDPVTLCTGITYDRHSIETWLDAGNNVCPLTNQRLHSRDLIPNHTVRRLIQDWCVANRSNGIDRIPTPTVPLSSAQVTRMLNDIAHGHGEGPAIRSLASMAKQSERNRKCIASSNAPLVLAETLNNHHNSQQSVQIWEDALAVLAAILPVTDDQARELLASQNALRSITAILRHGHPEGRTNAATILQEITGDRRYRERVGATDGLAEGLVRLIKESICPAATKAGIATVYRIAGTKECRVKLVQAGAVPTLLEILPEADRGVCERGLGALNVLCNCTEGRSAAYGHALTVPLVVKKILRVSELATEFAVSILWTICHNSSEDSPILEALRVGAFQKLLVLVQIGCTAKTRERATGLLKLFSRPTSDEWDPCTDTLDLKGVRRSF